MSDAEAVPSVEADSKLLCLGLYPGYLKQQALRQIEQKVPLSPLTLCRVTVDTPQQLVARLRGEAVVGAIFENHPHAHCLVAPAATEIKAIGKPCFYIEGDKVELVNLDELD